VAFRGGSFFSRLQGVSLLALPLVKTTTTAS
jgi:hypothetical protein